MRPAWLWAAAALALLALGGCGSEHRPPTSPPAPSVPGPIITGHVAPPPRDPLTSAQRRDAAAAVRRFLTPYVPYLYGRGQADRVAPVTPAVSQALRSGSARITPAQRRRHPRVAGLKVTGQTSRSALTAVRISDAGPAPYQLTLTVERRAGRWVISDLGDDG